MRLTFPRLLSLDERRGASFIRQIAEESAPQEGTLATFRRPRLDALLFTPQGDRAPTLIVPSAKSVPEGHSRVLQGVVGDSRSEDKDLRTGRWLRHPLLSTTFDPAQTIAKTLASWRGAFSYVAENPDSGVVGLRPPQLGAIHAVHAHWAISDTPATVVMPTGTGKTETMLALLISQGCERLLVIVPTDALRTQLAEKFLTLGILKSPDCHVLATAAQRPIVCTLGHIPRSPNEVEATFSRAHVVVTTSSIAGRATPEVQRAMANLFPYLFIDEAHHVAAPTWTTFKDKFKTSKIVQFTATPFREDGKRIDGKIVFNYPLKKAQAEDYFRPISFKRVVEFNQTRSDAAIAREAIEQLREDSDKGHILMARVDTVERAREVFPLYESYEEFAPVQLHTGIKSVRERQRIRDQILSGESRIVVCVDMLGEGFDLPELKIAAFHDIRKSLAVTLQLAGRFTRAREDLGHATFIANTADVHVQDELRKLYSRDPDWNLLLPQLSESVIQEQLSLQEFLAGFTQFATEVPLHLVRPALSTVVYKTDCSTWTPEAFREGIPGISSCSQVYHSLNAAHHMLVVVVARRSGLEWADIESLFGLAWELYIAVWDHEHNLLFIHGSTNAGEYRPLAHALAGESAKLIDGQQVFRTFAGVNRLRLQSVGLIEQHGRNIRYTQRMGSDVEPGLSGVQRARSSKSVLAGSGFEGGAPVAVGASRKGRIWSHRRGRVDQLAAWCKRVGAKLVDGSIDPDEILKGTLAAKSVAARPGSMPISIDWPVEIYATAEVLWSVVFGEIVYPLSEVTIELVAPSVDQELRFAISTETEHAELVMELLETPDGRNYRFVYQGSARVGIRHSGSGGPYDAAEFFYDNPPMFWFADGSQLEGNQHTELKVAPPPIPLSKIHPWDWRGVNIRKESQGVSKDRDSIQAKVIKKLLSKPCSVVFDDDGKGEVADVVAVRTVDDDASPSRIDIEFYHCKYSSAPTPGQRIGDLYEVCGQAQKSICWFTPPKRSDIFTHMLRREAHRQDHGVVSRYERGNQELVETLREMSRVRPMTLKVFIVQPGLSKAAATRDQLLLLGVTEHYLLETYQVEFAAITSS